MKRLLFLVVVLWSAAFARDQFDAFIDATEIPVLVHVTSPEVRDRNGHLLRAYTIEDGIWRMEVSQDQVDPMFFKMLIAYEDKRFHSHSGVDVIATLRALAQAVRYGHIVSGSSTLTMQVARLLEDGTTGQWSGKLRQMRLALALERHLTKDQILALYLRLAPYGGNVEGLRAASLIWLGKEPARLTPAEAALLVSLPQAPESRRPDRYPEAARIARNRVLLRMAVAGVIPMQAAQTDQLDPAPLGRQPMPQIAPHMSDRAIVLGPGRHDLTLERTLQLSLERLTARYMTGRDKRLSVAVVLADHQTGEILASVGSPDYTNTAGQGFVDMTRAQRSPGSTLKPIVYGLAFDRGLAHPETLILDTPIQFGTYAPQNFDGQYRGEIAVRRALQLSLNIPVIRLTEALGPAHLMAAMQSAGVKPGIQGGVPGLALALGGVGLTLEEMVQVYGALARGGEPIALKWRMGRDDEDAPNTRRILTPASAWMVGNVLSGLTPPPSAGSPGRVAYKTGTSYGHRDAWALGWTGQHVAGVWIGRPDGTPVPGAFGGDLAAPLLFEALGRAEARPVPLPAPPPETLLVSRAQLPESLQSFGPRAEVPALQLTFPPEGARLAISPSGIPVKLRGGVPPYTLLADGDVVATGLHRPEFLAPLSGPGFTTLSVIDAVGASGRVSIELR